MGNKKIKLLSFVLGLLLGLLNFIMLFESNFAFRSVEEGLVLTLWFCIIPSFLIPTFSLLGKFNYLYFLSLLNLIYGTIIYDDINKIFGFIIISMSFFIFFIPLIKKQL